MGGGRAPHYTAGPPLSYKTDGSAPHFKFTSSAYATKWRGSLIKGAPDPIAREVYRKILQKPNDRVP